MTKAVWAIDNGSGGNKHSMYDPRMGDEPIPVVGIGSNGVIDSAIYYGEDGKNDVGNQALIKGADDPANLIVSPKMFVLSEKKFDIRGTVKTAVEVYVDMMIASLEEGLADINMSRDQIELMITVPVCWPPKVKDEIISCMNSAGYSITPRQIMHESAAAAFHVAKSHSMELDRKRILVIDVGAGTTDITYGMISSKDGEVAIEDADSKGNGLLGGKNFDIEVGKFIERQLVDLGVDVDSLPPRDRRAIERKAKEIKEKLSKGADISEPVYVGGHAYSIGVSYEEYREATSGLIDSICRLAGTILESKDVDIMVLTGGGSLNPELRRKLLEMFPGIEGKIMDSEPIHSVSLGAASYYGALLAMYEGGVDADSVYPIADKSPYTFSLTARDDDDKIYGFPHIFRGSHRPATISHVYVVPEGPLKFIRSHVLLSDHDPSTTRINPCEEGVVTLGKILLPVGDSKPGDRIVMSIELLPLTDLITVTAECNGETISQNFEYSKEEAR